MIDEQKIKCTSKVSCRLSKICGLAKCLAGLLAFAAFVTSVQAQASVKLAWNPISNPLVAGYNIYYGGASGVYTNMISAGATTNLTIPNLVPGATYYFAETTYTTAGAESALSGEISYTVPAATAAIQLLAKNAGQYVLTMTGLTGHSYEIQATQNFKTWTVIGTVTVVGNTSVTFTDTSAANYSSRFYRMHDLLP